MNLKEKYLAPNQLFWTLTESPKTFNSNFNINFKCLGVLFTEETNLLLERSSYKPPMHFLTKAQEDRTHLLEFIYNLSPRFTQTVEICDGDIYRHKCQVIASIQGSPNVFESHLNLLKWEIQGWVPRTENVWNEFFLPLPFCCGSPHP